MRTVLLLVLAIGYPLLVLWQLQTDRLRDRLDVVLAVVVGVLFLLFARATVDWQAAPPWLWLIGLVLLAAGVARAGWLWPMLQWKKTRRRVTPVAIQLAIAAGLIVVLL